MKLKCIVDGMMIILILLPLSLTDIDSNILGKNLSRHINQSKLINTKILNNSNERYRNFLDYLKCVGSMTRDIFVTLNQMTNSNSSYIINSPISIIKMIYDCRGHLSWLLPNAISVIIFQLYILIFIRTIAFFVCQANHIKTAYNWILPSIPVVP